MKEKLCLTLRPRMNRDHQSHPGGRSSNEENGIADSEDVLSLQPDFRGLYSVCCSIRDINGMNKNELHEVFSEAGEVKDLYMTGTLLFIRFPSRQEAANCLQMHGSRFRLNVATPKNKKRGDNKDSTKSEKNLKGQTSSRRNADISDNNNKGKNNLNDTDISMIEGGDRNNKPRNMRSKRKGKVDNRISSLVNGHSGKEFNGHSSITEMNVSKEYGQKENRDYAESSHVELFAYNIESQDIFWNMLKGYKPVAVKLCDKQDKKYAFLSMASEEEAENLLAGLNGQVQIQRKLFVQYNNKYNHLQDDISVLSVKSDGSNSARLEEALPPLESIKEEKMPNLEPDYYDMPPLIKDFDVHDPEGRYDVDCRVYVSHFPFQSLESQLKGAFQDYHISDICMINNGGAQGCSLAVLYMSTIYDALRVVKEMNNSTYFGLPIQVFPGKDNVLLKHIFRREKGL